MSQASSPFLASVDLANDKHVCGWAFDRRYPQKRLAVSAHVGPRYFGPYPADIFRLDVATMYPGSDGYCGFKIPFFGIERGADAKIELQIDGARIAIGSSRSKLSWSLFKAPRSPKRVGDFLFVLDPPRDNISGWLSSIPEPSKRHRIIIESDGRIMGETNACLYRSSSQQSDGLHGFYFPFDCRQNQRLRLIEAESGIVLHRRQWLP